MITVTPLTKPACQLCCLLWKGEEEPIEFHVIYNNSIDDVKKIVLCEFCLNSLALYFVNR